jgi:hypothetical protein
MHASSHTHPCSSWLHVYTTHPETSNEHMRTPFGEQQAGKLPPLPLPAAFDKAYGAIHLATTARTHNSKHTRTHQCLPMHLLLGQLALFLDRRLSYLLFFTHPTLSFSFLQAMLLPPSATNGHMVLPSIGS